MKNNLLLHICCGVCLGGIIDEFSKDYKVHGYFFNPNIHPLTEFNKRMRGVKVVSERHKINVDYENEYGLIEYLEKVSWKGTKTERCRDCYKLRLEQTAYYASKHKFKYFATTLIISPFQDIEAINYFGNKAASKFNVNYYSFDALSLFENAQAIAKKYSIYRQQYCGCIFSEQERYSFKQNVNINNNV